MVSNAAAWITAAKASPFEIKPAPLGVPRENQILVENHAIAINPVDFKIQYTNLFNLKYPIILGQDIAGEVVATGPNATRFKEGDRVFGISSAFHTHRDEEKAFQAYTILQTNMTTMIPDNLSFEQAAVLPLGVATAASALFNSDFLDLQLPSDPAREPTGKSVLIWGGASSVGSNAVQLASAAGYEVLATASPKNFEYVKKLGASQVFDYKSSTVVSDLVDALNGKDLVGAFDSIGDGAWVLPIEILKKSNGAKLLITVTHGFPESPDGITIKHMFAPSIGTNHVGKAIFQDFLPKALKNGSYIAAPEPLIAGRGLESLQAAVELHRKGVSAQKYIVVL